MRNKFKIAAAAALTASYVAISGCAINLRTYNEPAGTLGEQNTDPGHPKLGLFISNDDCSHPQKCGSFRPQVKLHPDERFFGGVWKKTF